MQVVISRCAGNDIGKAEVVASARPGPGTQTAIGVRRFVLSPARSDSSRTG
jgi:hypothetical protein